jgi:Mrp family chromosome partitioning ATPase
LGGGVRTAQRSSSARPIVQLQPASKTATQLAEAALAVQEAAHAHGVEVVGFIDTGSGGTSATMCSNLALLNARAGKRTLLIEADPMMDTVPALPGATGYSLSDVMNGSVGVDLAAVPSKFEPNLFLLNIGSSVDRRFWTTENIAAFRNLRDSLKRHYDTIFVHLPPIKSNHLSLTVDAVVIVTAKRVTTVSELVDAATLLRIAEKPVLGVIISGLA